MAILRLKRIVHEGPAVVERVFVSLVWACVHIFPEVYLCARWFDATSGGRRVAGSVSVSVERARSEHADLF